MTTPLDKLRRYGCETYGEEELRLISRVLEDMAEAPLLDIGNVAAYYYEHFDQGKKWAIGDFPNVAPVFNTCWVSSSRAPRGFDGFVMAVSHTDLIQREEDEILDVSGLDYSSGHGSGVILTRPRPDRVRWRREILTIAQKGRRFIPLCLSVQYIEEDGATHLVDGRPRYVTRTFGPDDMPWDMKQNGVVVAGRLMEYPFLLATSLMHCRNVKIMEDAPPPRLSRKWERKHGFPLVSRYTLLIDPMREVLRGEGRSDADGLQKALHICRGHFKTYTPDKPRFGRDTGTFWYSPHVRGDRKRGEVVKDYAVKVPEVRS